MVVTTPGVDVQSYWTNFAESYVPSNWAGPTMKGEGLVHTACACAGVSMVTHYDMYNIMVPHIFLGVTIEIRHMCKQCILNMKQANVSAFLVTLCSTSSEGKHLLSSKVTLYSKGQPHVRAMDSFGKLNPRELQSAFPEIQAKHLNCLLTRL